MLYMKTITVRELRHNLKAVEKAVATGPVKVTKRGKPIWTIRAEKPLGKTARPDFTARSRAILGAKADKPIDVLEFIG